MNIIIVKKWQDLENGNSYYKVKIYDEGDNIKESKVTYGYDQQYKITAYDISGCKNYDLDYKYFLDHSIFEVINVDEEELRK